MDLNKVFTGEVSLLDVRAEGEFDKGAFPNSINIPILNDDERRQVGTAYRRHGAAAATKLGHKLVCGDVKAVRVKAWQKTYVETPKLWVTCWRGGQRSTLAQQWLQEAGVDIERVPGGYKNLRQMATTIIENAAQNLDRKWWVIAGKTGTAKTLLLRGLKSSIDLEGLAHHRGSAFGGQVSDQPKLPTFENALACQSLRNNNPTLILEDESRMIGRIALPESWHLRMQQSPLVLIEADLDARVAHIVSEYITEALTATTNEALKTQYLTALSKIQRRLGGDRFQQAHTLMSEAFKSVRGHGDWIAYLLENYYDPMYAFQLEKKSPRVAFKGSYDEVKAYLAELPT